MICKVHNTLLLKLSLHNSAAFVGDGAQRMGIMGAYQGTTRV